MKDILESKKRKDLSKYKYVYIPELKYFDNVTLFPESTIFFILDSLTKNGSYYKNDYCYFDIDWNLNDYKPFYYYLIAGKNFEEDRETVILIILRLFFFTYNIFVIILNIKMCRLKPLEQIYLYQFPKNDVCSEYNYIISVFLKYSFLSLFFIHFINHIFFFI